ncbi:MAG: sulfatase-like hydrolase/transferase [Lentisphaerae bacterium]|nr:sulfatase-like hydrolase/transferase [Lentisphaerota bacterium]
MRQDEKKPNILFIMPDQMRGDCLSLEHHPAALTPNMDEIGGQGAHFTRAYSTCASCIPARRSLLTGQFPATHGMVGYEEGCPLKAPTLPQVLRDAGYATALAGRYMHQSPYEEPYGYEQQTLGTTYIPHDDYARMLDREVPALGGIRGLGMSFNGWHARPWPLSEHLHPTNWVVAQARRMLAGHEANRPLFLTASFYAPHPPLIPPPFHMERCLRMDLPPAAIGDWAVPPPADGVGACLDAHRVVLRGEALRRAQAGYFGLINHLDDQLYWLIAEFKEKSLAAGRPWVIVFTSDHGEMLGDHYFFRKCEPYEGASRIPLLIQGSRGLGFKAGTACSQPVCLEDLMPTLLDLAAVPLPDGVDGRSLAPVLRGETVTIRPFLHGEHAPCYSREQAYHFLTDGKTKYIWRPTEGSEQLFDLDHDPRELRDLAPRAEAGGVLREWRTRLIHQLRERPEGFSDGTRLIAGRPYEAVMAKAKS